ncbi:MAG: hypothetical protein AYP45_12905 [Candidatus Brocadia carolinensis]|uniref:Transmembrane protein n=1 Tax=Candidatus Brocadia carolinensis TaxID=1004156 RepID=A0A1V4ARQ0_9BACT|nr:MAG: hypothetical protein AYP45_12905 [Candidatus Brocadia caroliniensis]
MSKGRRRRNVVASQDRFFCFYVSILNILMILFIKTREGAVKRRILGVTLPSGLAYNGLAFSGQ